MSRYRILEKKGTYKTVTPSESIGSSFDGDYEEIDVTREVYIPRYIVQEDKSRYARHGYREEFIDIKEFNDLEEARKFKNDLELEDGREVQ